MLVLRAREGLLRTAEARDASCEDIRRDLIAAHDRGVRPSERTRVHLADCARCRASRRELRSTRRRLRALAPIGPFGWLAKVLAPGAVKVCAAACIVAVGGVAAYDVWEGQRITGEGRRSPANLVGEVPVAGKQIRAGERLPAGFALAQRQVRLPVESKPVARVVEVACPPGMLVVAGDDPPTLRKTSRFQLAGAVPYKRSRFLRMSYAPEPRLARPGRLTVGALCQRADVIAADRRDDRRAAIARLSPADRLVARAGPVRRVCSWQAEAFVRRGRTTGESLWTGDRIRVAGPPRGGWVRGFAEGDVWRMAWMRTRKLCRA